MSGKHTPGRWFWALDKHNQPTCLMRSGSGDYVVSPQVEINDYGMSVHCWNDVSEQDARLIAAAPELLSAAIEAERVVSDEAESMRDSHTTKLTGAVDEDALPEIERLEAIASRLRATIAHATGEA